MTTEERIAAIEEATGGWFQWHAHCMGDGVEFVVGSDEHSDLRATRPTLGEALDAILEELKL